MNNILYTINPTVCACPILVICPITPYVKDPITDLGVAHTVGLCVRHETKVFGRNLAWAHPAPHKIRLSSLSHPR